VGLIDTEQDDAATLRAEDEAIWAAANPTPERELPTGTTLAQLIESLSDGSEVPDA
jgi:hypothetical protein